MILGVDMGGTKIAAAVVRDREVVERFSTATPDTVERVTQSLINVCHVLLKKHRCSAIAVSMPGFVDEKDTVQFAGHTLRFLVGMDVGAILGRFGLPFSIYNDADCFAAAEHRPAERTLGVVWGSGVGFGLVQGAYEFPVGSHIELGHQPYKHLTIEQAAGGVAVEQRYFHRTGVRRSIPTLWRRRKNDELAKRLTDGMLEAMIACLTTATLSFDPDRIVLGGSVSKLPVLLRLREGVAASLPEGIVAPRIDRAEDTGSGVVGAVILLLKSNKNKKIYK